MDKQFLRSFTSREPATVEANRRFVADIDAIYETFSRTSFEFDKIMEDRRRELEESGDVETLEESIGFVVGLFGKMTVHERINWAFDLEDERLEELFQSFFVKFKRSRPYKQYLLSPHWHHRRQVALEIAGHKCQVCNSAKSLNVHHRTYERLGEEADTDLLVLCKPCHQLFHDNGKLARPKDGGTR